MNRRGYMMGQVSNKLNEGKDKYQAMMKQQQSLIQQTLKKTSPNEKEKPVVVNVQSYKPVPPPPPPKEAPLARQLPSKQPVRELPKESPRELPKEIPKELPKAINQSQHLFGLFDIDKIDDVEIDDNEIFTSLLDVDKENSDKVKKLEDTIAELKHALVNINTQLNNKIDKPQSGPLEALRQREEYLSTGAVKANEPVKTEVVKIPDAQGFNILRRVEIVENKFLLSVMTYTRKSMSWKRRLVFWI